MNSNLNTANSPPELLSTLQEQYKKEYKKAEVNRGEYYLLLHFYESLQDESIHREFEIITLENKNKLLEARLKKLFYEYEKHAGRADRIQHCNEIIGLLIEEIDELKQQCSEIAERIEECKEKMKNHPRIRTLQENI